MKKLLLLIVALFCTFTLSAKATWYKSVSFSIAIIDANGLYHWEEDEESSVNICVDTDEGVITIYSPGIQVYRILKTYQVYKDNKGGQTLRFDVVDQDRDLGDVRLRIDKNGHRQLYVDFNDVAWMYNLRD